MRRIGLIGIIVLGLCLGYFGRSFQNEKPDRVAAALALFKTYCLPFAKGETVPIAARLVDISSWPNETLWADPDHALTLKRGTKICTISDELKPFTSDQNAALESEFSQLVASKLPTLKTETDASFAGWETFLLWAQYSRLDERRWAVYLTRTFANEDAAMTSLSISVPEK